MTSSYSTLPTAEIKRVQTVSLWVGIVASALCLAGAYWNAPQFFHSYLLAFLFWLGLALGCLALAMLHYLTPGAWGIVIRRPLESGFKTLPLMALLFIPLIFGLRLIYGWANGAALPREQLRYLNLPFFALRGAVYFAIWIVLAHFLASWSRQQDETSSPSLLQKARMLSGPGLVIYGLTASFAAVDWLMSLEPRWYSSIFGLLVVGGQTLSAMSFVISAVVLLAAYPPLADVLQPRHLHDLGNLLLTFLMLWAYLAFSQLLLIWSGNLPEEIPWYLDRWSGGWQWVGVVLIVFHFFVPFFLLLSRELKRNAKALATLAMFVLAMRTVDLFWLTAPEFSASHFRVHWMDIAAPIGMGGLWITFFVWQLKRHPLLPIGDPQLSDALALAPEHTE